MPELSNHSQRWTEKDERMLGFLWESGLRLSAICERMGRTEYAIADRAYLLGLPMGCPPGYEYLTAAVRRVGLCNAIQLRRILDYYDVQIHICLSIGARRKKNNRRWRRHFVDPELVDNAVKAWISSESVSSAARRRGVDRNTLRKFLIESGTPDPRASRAKQWRVTDEQVEAALRGHQ